MDVQIIQKILQQQKSESILLVVTQCQQFWNLMTWKTNILYIVEIFMKKFCEHLREHAKNVIDFENKKMLPLRKKN